MEKSDEKTIESSKGIKEERLIALKKKYQQPNISTVHASEFIDGCSDIAVCNGEGGY